MRPGGRFAASALVLLAGAGLWILWHRASGGQEAGDERRAHRSGRVASKTAPREKRHPAAGETVLGSGREPAPDAISGVVRDLVRHATDPGAPGDDGLPAGPLLDALVLSSEGRPLVHTELGLLAEATLFPGVPDWIARHRRGASEESPVWRAATSRRRRSLHSGRTSSASRRSVWPRLTCHCAESS